MTKDATGRRILICIPIISLLGFAVGIFLVPGDRLLMFGIGVAIGTVGSVLRVLMLLRSASRAIDLSPKDAENSMRISSLARLVITAAALGLSLLCGHFGLYGAIVGTIAMTLAAYIAEWLFKRSALQESQSLTQDPPCDEPQAPHDES